MSSLSNWIAFRLGFEYFIGAGGVFLAGFLLVSPFTLLETLLALSRAAYFTFSALLRALFFASLSLALASADRVSDFALAVLTAL